MAFGKLASMVAPATRSTTRPQWRKIRHALKLIRNDALTSRKALALANLSQDLLSDPRLQVLILKAEAALTRTVSQTVYQAATSGEQTSEGSWTPAGVDPDSRTPTRVRAWSKKDWKAASWLLERRFPAEYGSQQPAQVAETVVAVLGALAALRQQPASLGSLRHVPQLPSGEDTRAREGQAT